MTFGKEGEVQIIFRVDFTSVEMRVVRMVRAAIFPVAGKPAYLLQSEILWGSRHEAIECADTHLSQWEEL